MVEGALRAGDLVPGGVVAPDLEGQLPAHQARHAVTGEVLDADDHLALCERGLEVERASQELGVPRSGDAVAPAAPDRSRLPALGVLGPGTPDARHVTVHAGVPAVGLLGAQPVLGDPDDRPDGHVVAGDAEGAALVRVEERMRLGGVGLGRVPGRAQDRLAVGAQVAGRAGHPEVGVVLAGPGAALRGAAGERLRCVAAGAPLLAADLAQLLLVVGIHPGEGVGAAAPLLRDSLVALRAGEARQVLEQLRPAVVDEPRGPARVGVLRLGLVVPRLVLVRDPSAEGVRDVGASTRAGRDARSGLQSEAEAGHGDEGQHAEPTHAPMVQRRRSGGNGSPGVRVPRREQACDAPSRAATCRRRSSRWG